MKKCIGFEENMFQTAKRINSDFGRNETAPLLSCVYCPVADNIESEWTYLVNAEVAVKRNSIPITTLDTLLWHQSFAILEDRYETYRKKETYTEEIHLQIENCIRAILDNRCCRF